MLLTSFAQAGADERGPVVSAQLCEQTMALDQARQHVHHAGSGQGEVDFHFEQLAVIIVEHVQRPEAHTRAVDRTIISRAG